MSAFDLRLAAPALAAWLAAVVVAHHRPAVGFIVAVLGALGAALLTIVGSGRTAGRRRLAAASCLCAAGAAAAVAWRVSALERSPLRPLAERHAHVTIELRVDDDPQRLRPHPGLDSGRTLVGTRATALLVADEQGTRWRLHVPVFVLAGGNEWLGLQPTQRIRAEGVLQPGQRGRFQAATFAARGPPITVSPAAGWQSAADRVRDALQRAAVHLPPAAGGLLPGLVDGDTSRLPDTVAADFTTTGLSHLVAVSGTNVSIYLAALLAVCRRLVPRIGGRIAVAVAGLACFVVVARPHPSVLRAATMGLVLTLGRAAGGGLSGVGVLGAATLLLVYADPALATNYGFALSVVATAALLVAAPPLTDLLARRLPRSLAEALAIPLAASTACAPLIVTFAGTISVYAVPANMAAEVAVAPATVLGVAAAAVAPWWSTGGAVLATLGAIPCAWIVSVARVFAALPGATLRWPPGAVGGVALAAVELSVAAAVAFFGHASQLLRYRSIRDDGFGSPEPTRPRPPHGDRRR